jgi:VCBS repeat-containing protein
VATTPVNTISTLGNSSELFLLVYDSTSKNTYSLDTGLTLGDLLAHVNDSSFTLYKDLSTDTNWTTGFLKAAGFNAATTTYGLVVANNLNDTLLTTSSALNLPLADSDSTLSQMITAIKTHAGEINSGTGIATGSKVVNDSSTTDTGKFDDFNTLFGNQATPSASVAGKYGDALSFYSETLTANNSPVVTKFLNSFKLVGNTLTFGNPTIPTISTDSAPTLNTPIAITYTDTIFNDVFKPVTGKLVAEDIAGAILTKNTYGIDANGGNAVTENSSQNTASQTNKYGKLTVDHATGAYKFEANDSAIEALKVKTSATFKVTTTSSDGKLNDSDTLTINVIQKGTTESLGNDKLTGTNAINKFDGLAGNDIIKGLGGNDFLTGGLGKDLLTGGKGKDTFDFNATAESKKGALKDIITDFSHKEGDKIDLAGIDANTKTNVDNKFKFIGSSEFHKIAGELHFINGVLSGDTNGDAKADFEIAITGANNLVNADFML